MRVFDKHKIHSSYLADIKQLWLNTPDTFPDFLPVYDDAFKAANEQWIDSAARTMQKQLQSSPKLLGKKRWREETQRLILTLLNEAPVLALHQTMSPTLQYDFLAETKRFLKQARSFDQTLCIEDLGQAFRNYVVYGVFCILSGMPQHCHSAIWGYSMLYPYTDNYIDSPDCSPSDQKTFHVFIERKLKGEAVIPSNQAQRQTGELLDAIEAFYPRGKHSDIYDGLLMMLEAQDQSLTQSQSALSEEEILDISVYKGGVSVLLDRFLVEKELTEEEIRFYLAYGLFLQFADDLQDITSDEAAGSRTVLNLHADSDAKEKTVNKILHFLHIIITTWLPSPRTVRANTQPASAAADSDDRFTAFLLHQCYLLILASVWRSREHFTAAYLEKTEHAMPVSFRYLSQTAGQKNSARNSSAQIAPDSGYDVMNMLDAFLEDVK